VSGAALQRKALQQRRGAPAYAQHATAAVVYVARRARFTGAVCVCRQARKILKRCSNSVAAVNAQTHTVQRKQPVACERRVATSRAQETGEV